jgi:hypothetical protein
VNRSVSGDFDGTTTWEFFEQGCSFVHQAFDVTYTVDAHHTGSLHVDGCVDFTATFDFTYAGTFVLTAPNGATLTGTATGDDAAAGIHMTLTVAHGTKNFTHVTGTIAATGSWHNEPPDTLGHGPASGTLAGALRNH